MTDVETLQKIDEALIAGLVCAKLREDEDKEQQLEDALDLLRPLIVSLSLDPDQSKYNYYL